MELVIEEDLSKNMLENMKTSENIILEILKKSGFVLNVDISEINGILIPRNLLINDEKYIVVKEYLEKLKKHKMFSSSFLTSLHKDAEKKQKWPLLNLVRQILKVNDYRMKPIRKSDGKTKLGKKKYIRFFLIEKLKKTKELEINT
tara:strand:- start:1344 stop:1781 length:438 start_codon:yes stop_codon:yes gene_type:complete